MTKRLFLSALLICLIGAVPLPADDEADAQEAVEAWLAVHDAGRYEETWDMAAQFVKGQLSREQWKKRMSAALAPLGKVESRVLHAANPASELPGMPDGKYVVFEYKTEFENKKSAIETIIPMVEDGQWKVMTYRVR